MTIRSMQGSLLLAGALLAVATDATAGTNAVIRVGGGTLHVPGTIAQADIHVDGGVLAGDGDIVGAVVLGNGGSLAPGSVAGAGTIAAASLTWQPGAGVRHRLGTGDVESDHTALSGALARSGTGTYAFAFDDADTPPTAGTTYTLMTFASQTGFSASDFSYTYAGAAPALNGQFSLTATALLFQVTSLPVSLQSFTID